MLSEIKPYKKVLVFEDDSMVRNYIKTFFEMYLDNTNHNLDVSFFLSDVDLSDIKRMGFFSESFVLSDMNLDFSREISPRFVSSLAEHIAGNRLCSNSESYCCKVPGLKLSCQLHKYLVSIGFPVITNFSYMTATKSDFDKKILTENGGLVFSKDELLMRDKGLDLLLQQINPGNRHNFN